MGTSSELGRPLEYLIVSLLVLIGTLHANIFKGLFSGQPSEIDTQGPEAEKTLQESLGSVPFEL